MKDSVFYSRSVGEKSNVLQQCEGNNVAVLSTLGGATPLLRHRPSPVSVSLCVCPCAPECYIREGKGGGGPTPMPRG